jgi:hypothetical protein
MFILIAKGSIMIKQILSKISPPFGGRGLLGKLEISFVNLLCPNNYGLMINVSALSLGIYRSQSMANAYLTFFRRSK